MTDQDNLRDRIAGVLAETYSPGGRGVQFEDAVAAQAIIDEFGLTVEERFVYATALARDDEPVTNDMAQRVIGKWEKQ